MRFVLKNDGRQEPFDPEKLKASLVRAGASSLTADEVVKEIDAWLSKPATTGAIYKKAFSILRKNPREKALAIRYSLRRSIAEFGPTGFPFEQFVAAILKAKGFTVETGRMVQGRCVDHEVDVVAWKDNELLLCEVKFHSELAAKSDLKVALYIDARFEDLRDAEVETSGGKKIMTDGLLITNTKFTHKAVEYSSCSGVELIGWNYPARGNLHDIIIETGIHPVTCLPSLTSLEKKLIMDKKIVSCVELGHNPSIFDEIPSLREKKEIIMSEIGEICG